jgi:NAD dependent epimerase/dehydratase family enzyme
MVTVLIHDEGVSESRISIDIRLLSQEGQRVIPNKALSCGFVFRHETLHSAFEAIL